jgi:proteasome lid subunit RPN8/RPN11
VKRHGYRHLARQTAEFALHAAASIHAGYAPQQPAESPQGRRVQITESPRLATRDAKGRLLVEATILDQIAATIGFQAAETGGFVGLTDGVIDHFRFDATAINSGATYEPDIAAANDDRRFLAANGSTFAGFAHSHPGSLGHPSLLDRVYAQRLWAKVRCDELVLPIVLPARQGRPARINFFVARPGLGGVADVDPVRVEVVRPSPLDQFERVRGAYDPEWLRRCRLVAIGAGGARHALEDLVRVGLGQLVLIDPDTVGPENLSTQGVFTSEIGRPKVLACADALKRINPAVTVIPIQKRVQDIPREQLGRLLTEPWPQAGPPARVLVGGWTDSIPADAYGHRAALAWKVPFVQAALHRGGASGEVILVYPGLTRGCVRCATASRYDHYLSGGANDATSAGAPYWATPRLNALKVCVTLAAFHAVMPGELEHVSEERITQTALLKTMAARQLALLRLNPDASNVSGVTIHERLLAGCSEPESFFFDETVWRTIEPREGCPDCGGTGDLLSGPAFTNLDAIPVP